LAAVLGLGFGCGESEGGSGSAGNGGSTAAGGSSGAGTAAGKAGSTATAGAANGGSSSGNAPTAGQPDAQAGAGNEAGSTGDLVDCDPKKILCKRLAPTCEAGQVPSVAGSCYGDCVKIERCACNAAEQCPAPDQYTCWAKQHCGPFVQ